MTNGSMTQIRRTIMKHIALSDIVPQAAMVKNALKIIKQNVMYHLSKNDNN